MTPADLKLKYVQHPKTEQLVAGLKTQNRFHLSGTYGSGNSLIIAAIALLQKENQLVVYNDKEEAAYIYNDLQHLLGEDKVLFFPASYKKAYQIEDTDNANVLLRTEVLNKLSAGESQVVISYAAALTEKVISKEKLEQNTLKIHKGEHLSISFINEVLQEYHFEKVDFVIEPGQFAVRGGIIDMYSYSNDNPYRIELFGDEVESIRVFDPVSQLSSESLERIEIVSNIQGKILEESHIGFLEFIEKNTTIWLQDFSLSQEKIKAEYEKAETVFDEKDSPIRHINPKDLYLQPDDFAKQILGFKIIEFGQNSYFDSKEIMFNQAPQPIFNKKFDLLAADFEKNKAEGYQTIVLAANLKQVERLRAVFEDLKADNTDFDSMLFVLHSGFIDHDIKISCYTDHQIFNRYHRFNLKNSYHKKAQAISLKELKNLQPGDFVTHIDHGVGRFSGLEKMDVNGKEQEAIRLIYQNQDILYVSIHSLHKIAKYTGKEGTPQRIDKLGSGHWQKVKQKTKSRVKTIAYDLIKLYAERKASKGFAFASNNYLMNELEASFIYEETPDQLTAMDAVIKDMEAESPMDRLVCGDVGFGKTEVAVRAAFKAICDSKQVAVLVPTTILALQHYKTFKNRLEGFPVTVDYINRFKTAKQQKETLQKLAEGKVDIIIGTHRLAGKDIKFKDLGLLVIDEEQKFGVSVKDKLKTLKVNVDTLTLTATPIPRTLQFSLMNARDLSVISTPPPNRRPIETQVCSFNEEIIRDAVSYETSRGGQVFFVHNHIENIKEIAGMIQRLCPDARVLVAHGQMKGDELEQKMMAFINEEYDVLVSTTIIESGLDIPNANTIIINDANRFGLSDLHQIRGRTGRSNKKAFCYLLAPPPTVLTPEARKRLEAIEKFSDLGSGLQIAMRDLDIRGAGDILGAEQSGFIAEVGIDMYQKILQEAIQELKENEFKEMYQEELKNNNFITDCQIETDLEILIPDEYVSNIAERLALYTELDNIEKEEELIAFEKRLIDRFGEIPEETKALFGTVRLRRIAGKIGLEKLVLKQQRLIGYFIANQESAYFQSAVFGQVLKYVQRQSPEKCKMKEKNGKLLISFADVVNISQAIDLLSPIMEMESVAMG